MSVKKAFYFFIIVVFCLLSHRNALSWDEKRTHPNLSAFAADSSVLSASKGDYLKNLGFTDGLIQTFKWGTEKNVKEWIQIGSTFEDAGSVLQMICGYGRSFNHFHNPLKPWDSAGLNDYVPNLCPPLIPPLRQVTGESSLLWAQDSAYQATYTDLEGDWSWEKARDYFYLALTSVTDSARQEYFARTFKGLGHQIHLVQDGAVPDHARNDAHPLPRNKAGGLTIEAWGAEAFPTVDALKAFAPTPQFPAMPLDPSQFTLDTAYYTRNLVPSALFIDTDQYTLNTLDQFFASGLATSNTIGITEYTNANFASQHTIFAETLPQTDRHYFPYPNESSTNIQELISKSILPETVIAQDGVSEPTLYIKKERDGEHDIVHFAKPRYTTTGRWDLVGGGTVYDLDFYLDEACHEDYARLLIPRAVGYSAGLLNYFFRGQIEAVNRETITDSAGNITGMKFKVKNNTPGEAMEKPGKLVVSYEYTPSTGGNPVYGVSSEVDLKQNIGSGSESPTYYIFTFNGFIPSNAQEAKCWLVFRGKLGNEDDAVAAQVTDLRKVVPAYYVYDPVNNEYGYIVADRFMNPLYYIWYGKYDKTGHWIINDAVKFLPYGGAYSSKSGVKTSQGSSSNSTNYTIQEVCPGHSTDICSETAVESSYSYTYSAGPTTSGFSINGTESFTGREDFINSVGCFGDNWSSWIYRWHQTDSCLNAPLQRVVAFLRPPHSELFYDDYTLSINETLANADRTRSIYYAVSNIASESSHKIRFATWDCWSPGYDWVRYQWSKTGKVDYHHVINDSDKIIASVNFSDIGCCSGGCADTSYDASCAGSEVINEGIISDPYENDAFKMSFESSEQNEAVFYIDHKQNIQGSKSIDGCSGSHDGTICGQISSNKTTAYHEVNYGIIWEDGGNFDRSWPLDIDGQHMFIIGDKQYYSLFYVRLIQK